MEFIGTVQPLMHGALNDHVMANLCPEYGKRLRNMKLESLKLFITKIKNVKIIKPRNNSWKIICAT